MRRNWIVGLVCALSLVTGTLAHAVNSVSIQSMTVDPNQAGVEIKGLVANDISIAGMVVPLVIRSVSGGAGITSLQLTFRDRLAVGKPELRPIEVTNILSAEDGACKNDQAGGFHTIEFIDTLQHPTAFSPVGILLVRNSLFQPPLPPGADVTGSINLIVDIGPNQGLFEVDTTCTDPANHLSYTRDSDGLPETPSFSKGTIAVGNPPIARDTAWSTNEDVPRNVSYLPASDVDPEPLTFAIVDGPFNGQVGGFDANTGAFTYTPDPEYSGLDSIKFEAADGVFTSNVGTVRITVVAVNDPPVARDTAVTTDEDVPVSGQLFGSDIDGPGPLTFEIQTNPIKGDLIAFDGSTGAFTYQPDPDFNGTDQFVFRTRDGLTVSPSATVQITVNPINDPPVARDSSFTVAFETPTNGRFHASDVDGPSITFAQLAGPFNGTFTGFNASTGEFTYTPDSAYFGADSVTFEATDGLLTSNVGTIRITVSSSDCVCQFWGDPHRDGFLDASDLNVLVNVVLFNGIPSHSVRCPTSDPDFNCDCVLDMRDFNVLVQAIFFNQPLTCDPCGAICR